MWIQDNMAVKVEDQRLIFGTKQLEDAIDGEEMTFGKYRINNGACIVLVIRLSGG